MVKEYIKKITVVSVGWHDTLLCFSFEVDPWHTEDTFDVHVFLEAYNEKSTVARCECAPACFQGKTIWSGLLDARNICKHASKHSREGIRFRLAFEQGKVREVLPCANTKFQTPGCMKAFTSGYYATNDFLLLPDETGTRDFILRLVGSKEDVSQQAYAHIKRNRPLYNNILLQSFSVGAGVAQKTAQAIKNGTLWTRIYYNSDDEPCVLCRVNNSIEFSVCLSSTGDLTPLTFLDEGKTLDEVTYDTWCQQERDILLKPFFFFDDFCREHGFKYMLGYGTLIGAYRHRGLIPWDHDVDIVMHRDEYMKLRAFMDSPQAPEGWLLDDWMSIPGYPCFMGRVIQVGSTKFNVNNTYGHAGIGNFGLAFDIFVICPVSCEEGKEQELANDYYAFDELYIRMRRGKMARRDLFASRYEMMQERFAKEGPAAVYDDIWNHMMNAAPQDTTHYLTSTSAVSIRRNHLFDKAWFDKTVDLPFEGRMLPAPAGYLEFLRSVYGPNFRKFPADRIPKRYIHLRDENLPFGVVNKTYLSEYNPKDEIDARSRAKDVLMEESVLKCQLYPHAIRLAGRKTMLKHEAAFKKLDVFPKVKGEYKKIDAVCSPYYELQFGKDFSTWMAAVPISNGYFELALENLLCYRGESGDAYQLISSRIIDELQESDSLRIIYDAINKTIKMRDCYDYHDYARAGALAKEVLSMYPYAVEAKAMLWLLDLEGNTQSPKDLETMIGEIIKEGKRTVSILPLFLLAVAYKKQGKTDQSFALADCVINKTDDGMLIQYLEDMQKEIGCGRA
ncbi:MAG: LicD family protein [Coriobacteriales bacterium]|nr:LicD family protein [Coriobacteriales bacterium]